MVNGSNAEDFACYRACDCVVVRRAGCVAVRLFSVSFTTAYYHYRIPTTVLLQLFKSLFIP